VVLSACDQADPRRVDLHLPEGDSAKGEVHFVALGCSGCHSVVGADLPEPAEPGPVRVLLGSRSTGGMSYGRLVTAIVNPSHRLAGRYRSDEVSEDGESLMTTYNDVMTVTQLMDLVAFLQDHYQVGERPGYRYPTYNYKADEEPEDPERH
jgi:hypothetical protein